MTDEQKDWYDYGRKKAAWFAIRRLDPGNERILTQVVWDARKKAYRWLDKYKCECCIHFDEEWDGSPCPWCNSGQNDNWQPKEYNE